MIRRRPPPLDKALEGAGSSLSEESPLAPLAVARSASVGIMGSAPHPLAAVRMLSDSVLMDDPKSIGQLAIRHQLEFMRSASSHSLADDAATLGVVTVGGREKGGVEGLAPRDDGGLRNLQGPRQKGRLFSGDDHVLFDDVSCSSSVSSDRRPGTSESTASGSSGASLGSAARAVMAAPPAYTVSPVHAAPPPRRLRKQGLHIDVSTSGEDEDYHAAEDAYGHFPCDALDHSNTTEDGLTHAPNLKDDDDFVFSPSPAIKTARALGLQDRGEGEGRAAYSQVAGNFDLGGFKIGASGLVSSPRNRGRRRPSLNEGDNFVILARLGSGSSSSVHKALHLPTMRLVALKSLPLYDAERRAQLMRELRVLYSNLASINSSRKGRGGQRNDREAALHEGAADNTSENTVGAVAHAEADDDGYCPYIVSFYDAFADAKHGCLNLVVEYMDGGSLQDLVDRGGCADEHILAHLSYNILMGLTSLHDMKKIHRDIKPSNLLINSQGYVKIADFGVSRSMENSGTDLADTFIGTLGFMSPERITGQEYSYAADMWGFGLSILACALGCFPLQGSQKGASGGYWGLVAAVVEDPPPELPDSFSPAFRDMVRRCLLKDARQRASARELLNHPFIKGRTPLPTDNEGRPAYMHESQEVRVLELEGICRAVGLHVLSRRAHGALNSGGGVSPVKSAGIDHGMIERLGEELGLDTELVSLKFEEQFRVIQSASPWAVDDPSP